MKSYTCCTCLSPRFPASRLKSDTQALTKKNCLIDFLPYLSDLKCQHLYLTYILILVDNVHSSGLKFSHEGEIRPHGGADKDVIKPITVDVTGGDSVAEVGANLISRQIVQICQV